MNMSKEEIVITQQRMAGWLMYNGFCCTKVKRDLKNPKRSIYIFDFTPELSNVMSQYKNLKYCD